MKYGFNVCKCGRIHIFPFEKIEEAIDKDKVFVLVCGGCGAVTGIGASYFAQLNREKEWFQGTFSCSFDKPFSITADMALPKYGTASELFFSDGIRIPIMTGRYATEYNPYSGFSDMRCPDATTLQSLEKLNEYIHNCSVVDMARFIDENAQSPEILSALASQDIIGLNWAGTAFAQKTTVFEKRG